MRRILMDKRDRLVDANGVKWRCMKYTFAQKTIVQCKTCWIKELAKMKKIQKGLTDMAESSIPIEEADK